MNKIYFPSSRSNRSTTTHPGVSYNTVSTSAPPKLLKDPLLSSVESSEDSELEIPPMEWDSSLLESTLIQCLKHITSSSVIHTIWILMDSMAPDVSLTLGLLVATTFFATCSLFSQVFEPSLYAISNVLDYLGNKARYSRGMVILDTVVSITSMVSGAILSAYFVSYLNDTSIDVGIRTPDRFDQTRVSVVEVFFITIFLLSYTIPRVQSMIRMTPDPRPFSLASMALFLSITLTRRMTGSGIFLTRVLSGVIVSGDYSHFVVYLNAYFIAVTTVAVVTGTYFHYSRTHSQ